MTRRTSACPDCGGPMYRYANTCNGCKSKGERNPRFGTTMSAETRAKIGAKLKGKVYGPRTDDPQDGRGFARRWFPLPDLCERCQDCPPLDRHHVDGDTRNNDPGNIAFLCRKCHQAVDGRVEILRQNGHVTAARRLAT